MVKELANSYAKANSQKLLDCSFLVARYLHLFVILHAELSAQEMVSHFGAEYFCPISMNQALVSEQSGSTSSTSSKMKKKRGRRGFKGCELYVVRTIIDYISCSHRKPALDLQPIFRIPSG